MSVFYKSLRVGKGGKYFFMYKFRTMIEGADRITRYANERVYTRFGKFMRKWKIDEFPQVWNILKGDMNLVGPRPEEPNGIEVVPADIRNIVLSVKPGLTDLSSIYFYNEEEILRNTKDPNLIYWTKIKPVKLLLQVFYIKNKCLLLNAAILWLTLKKLLKK